MIKNLLTGLFGDRHEREAKKLAPLVVEINEIADRLRHGSEDELKAKLRGFVKIQFKTDYFKLDNFAQMYGPASQDEKAAASAPPAK